MKKIFKVLGKIFTGFMHIFMLWNWLMLVFIGYCIITDKPIELDETSLYLANTAICYFYFQHKEIEELKKSINNDKN